MSSFDAFITQQTKVTLDSDHANNYATQCYSSDALGTLDCASFVVKNLPGSVNRDAPCPFKNGLCRNNGTNLLLDTGLLDSHDHFGINTPPDQRIQMRNVMHCAPLKTEGHTSNHDIQGHTFTKYDYGPYLSGPGDNVTLLNHTFQFKSIETQYPIEREVAVANAATGLNFRLV
jgi:hypothetical protein